jgi:hypothetical protein
MNWFIAVVAVLIPSSCLKQGERVYAIDALISDNALLANFTGKCRSNPGEFHNTRNRLNAEAADGKIRLERMCKLLGG